MEQSFEGGDRSAIEKETNIVSSRLFADAYDLTVREAFSKQSAAPGTSRGTVEQPASEVGDKIPTEPANYDPYVSIFRNVTPQIHTLADGDTVESLARRNLGAGATEQELRDYINEIRDINSGSDFAVGDIIVLPGHTANGDIIMPNKDGTTYTISGDPAQRWADEQRLIQNLPSKPRLDVTAGSQQGSAAQNHGCYPSYIDVEVYSRDGRSINRIREAYMNCPGQPRQRIPVDRVPWVNIFPWLRR